MLAMVKTHAWNIIFALHVIIAQVSENDAKPWNRQSTSSATRMNVPYDNCVLHEDMHSCFVC